MYPAPSIAASICCLWLAMAPVAGGQDKANPKDKLKELLQERLATGQMIHDVTVKGYTQGDPKFTLDQVHEAKVKLLEARLDLAETKEQRLKVHEEAVQDAREWEEVASKIAQAGRGPPVEVLRARSYHLERRIALERAKMASPGAGSSPGAK